MRLVPSDRRIDGVIDDAGSVVWLEEQRTGDNGPVILVYHFGSIESSWTLCGCRTAADDFNAAMKPLASSWDDALNKCERCAERLAE